MGIRGAWYSGLLWIYERSKILDRETRRRNAAYAGKKSIDGVPLPPAGLRVKVAGTADIYSFLDGGEKAAATVRDLLAGRNIAAGEIARMLDFGCGCGRVLRQWRGLSREQLHGVDCNSELIEWCGRNLENVTARVSEPGPPLDYASGTFDVIYAFSVLTHMPEDLQRAWIGEFRRILSPTGRLIFSTHGQYYFERLSGEEKKKFERGEVVVRHMGARGTNYCNSFHPEPWVREQLLANWEVEAFVACGARGNPMQDVWMARPN